MAKFSGIGSPNNTAGPIRNSPENSSANSSPDEKQKTTEERAQMVMERKRRSMYWLSDNYYPQWEQVFKSYKCERDPELDPDGNPDPSQTSIGMPDTYRHVRSNVARVTAQLPHVKFRSNDPALGELISRSIMYCWDRANVQRQQKRHVTQAQLFGWSVRPWYWDVDEQVRTRRIDPMKPESMSPEIQGLIQQTYGKKYNFQQQDLSAPNGQGSLLLAQLMAKESRGKRLPVKYPYIAYQGPRCDFLFVGDCYPEPNFDTLQTSNWFIVERRRNNDWLDKIQIAYPSMVKGIADLLQRCPDGTPLYSNSLGGRDSTTLRRRLANAIDRTTDENLYGSPYVLSKEWTITEQYTPGADGKLTFIGEDGIFLGEVPLPYDLNGMMPFTELLFIDDILAGIGDSTARVMRGLQQLHDRQNNVRFDLVNTLLRPLYGTTDADLYEQPELFKRFSGGRMVKFRRQGDLWVVGEQAAMASVANGLQDEASIERQFAKITGDNNMSSNANVDPSQNKTATGARISAFNQDILTKDQVDMFTLSLTADAYMMYLLLRSELPDSINFDAANYNRAYASDQDLLKQQFVTVEPEDFQIDGEVEVEAGSTLADDDDARTAKAGQLWQIAQSAPGLFNMQKARDEVLIANGKGRELQQWAAPPQPPPPVQEMKSNLTIAAKFETFTPEVQAQVMEKAGIEPPPPPPAPAGPPTSGVGAPPSGTPPGVPPGPPGPATSVPPGVLAQMAAGPPPAAAAQSYDAAKGHPLAGAGH